MRTANNSSLGNHLHNPAAMLHCGARSSAPHSHSDTIAQSNTANTRIVDSNSQDSKGADSKSAESARHCETCDSKSWRAAQSANPHKRKSISLESQGDSSVASSRPLRGAEALKQGGSSAAATLELEADKRGTPLDCRKSGGFFGVKGSGEGINPFLRKENNENVEIDSESKRDLRSRGFVASTARHENPADSLPMTKNTESQANFTTPDSSDSKICDEKGAFLSEQTKSYLSGNDEVCERRIAPLSRKDESPLPPKKIDFLSLFLYTITRLAIFTSVATFAFVIGYILWNGIEHLSPSLFEWEYTSENVSMLPAIINTLTMVALSLAIATPLAIFGAIFLEEYANSSSRSVRLIVVAAETLTGIPSIVYGLFGYLAFVIYFGLGLSLLSGALTLAIMVLPLILRNTQEALKAVPILYKEASFGLGAGKLRTIFRILLPCAISGILAGVILGVGRIVGESAALLYSSGTVAQVADLHDSGRTLSVHMYALLSEGQFMEQAYATAVVLLAVVIGINVVSNLVARYFNPNRLK